MLDATVEWDQGDGIDRSRKRMESNDSKEESWLVEGELVIEGTVDEDICLGLKGKKK